MNAPTLSAEYDDGYFDKDEQGWVANRTSVVSRSDGTVKVRQWGDSNGRDAYDRTFETRIAAHLEALKLVKLERWPWYFDLAKDRLINADTYENFVRRPAKGEWWSTPRVVTAVDFLCALAATLGAPRLTCQAFSGWPARGIGVDTYAFTKAHFPLPLGGTLDLSWRPAIRADCVPEIGASLVLPQAQTHLTVTEKGELHLGGSGPFELRAAAREAAASWDW